MIDKTSPSKSVFALTTAVLLLFSIIFAGAAFANVPTIVSLDSSINNHRAVLNVNVQHSDPTSNHYIDKIELKVDGTVQQIGLSPQVNSTFTVTRDLGVTDKTIKVEARAHCTIHGWGAWSTPLTVQPSKPAIKTSKESYTADEYLQVSGTADSVSAISIQVFDPSGERRGIAQAYTSAKGSFTASNVYKFTSKDPEGVWKVQAYQGGTFFEATFEVKHAVTPEPTPTPTPTPEPTPPVKTSTKLSISLSKSAITQGETITVSGSISPAVPGVKVYIKYLKDGVVKSEKTVTTTSSGSFDAAFTPDSGGSWTVTARWEGNENYQGSEGQASFTVVSLPPLKVDVLSVKSSVKVGKSQTIKIRVTDEAGNKKGAVNIKGKVIDASGGVSSFSGVTKKNGIFVYKLTISKTATPGTYTVELTASLGGYSDTVKTLTFTVTQK